MDKATTEATRSMNLADLKEVAGIDGPCLTITVPIHVAESTSRQDHMRLRSAVQAAEALLTNELAMKSPEIREFLDPILQVENESLAHDYGTLAIFRSPDYFRAFQVRAALPESAVLGNRFHVLPILRHVQDEQRHFYILALSQKHVRLLRCTNHSSEEVPFGPNTPTSVEQWLNTRTPTTSPDHGTTHASDGGSTSGNFTSTQDRDNLDSHIGNFFHRIDEAVREILRGETAPLILAAVEYEVAMYRDVNGYPHLAEQHVHGAPDSLKGGELHKRALEAAEHAFEAPLRKALETYERLGGSERVSRKPGEIVKAAAEARIAHLFLAEGATFPGRWNASTLQMESDENGEDMLNFAALQTIAQGGEVWVIPPERVPDDLPIAALLRY